MSFVPDVRAPLEQDGPMVRGVRESASPTAGITTAFNLAMFAYMVVLGILQFLVASEKAMGVPLPGLIVTSLIDLARYVAVLLITSALLREFWRRLVSPLFEVRSIAFREALAIVLMISILFRA
jgi:hypothetical protein